LSRSSKWARMDWLLLVNALALCAIGLLNVYSGTRVHGVPGSALVTRQLLWILLGVVAFFAVSSCTTASSKRPRTFSSSP